MFGGSDAIARVGVGSDHRTTFRNLETSPERSFLAECVTMHCFCCGSWEWGSRIKTLPVPVHILFPSSRECVLLCLRWHALTRVEDLNRGPLLPLLRRWEASHKSIRNLEFRTFSTCWGLSQLLLCCPSSEKLHLDSARGQYPRLE